jgi:two-component system response regulator CpxR
MREDTARGHAAKKVLLIDDDTELCALMRDFFAPHGFALETVHDGQRGLARAFVGGFDLIVLDVMLPLLDGFEVLRQIRRRSAVPIIMLTARTEQQDRIAGLEAGADDYLPKPFGPEELLARMRAVLRRSGHTLDTRTALLEVGRVRVDERERLVWIGQTPVDFTDVEFDILGLLMRSAGRVVSRDAVWTVLYQRPSTPYERSLEVHISRIRKKLEQGGRVSIRSVRGVGYVISAIAEGPR